MLLKQSYALISAILNAAYKQYQSQYYIFSIFAMLNYVTPFLIEDFSYPSNLTLKILRFTAVVSCFFLAIKEYWPKNIRHKYFPLYWCYTLWFCLPLINSYAMFLTTYKGYWIINTLSSFILLCILMHWRGAALLIVIAVLTSFSLNIGTIHGTITTTEHKIYVFAYCYALTFSIVLILMRYKNKRQNRRIENMRIINSVIAHEVKSPIATIKTLSYTLQTLVRQAEVKSHVNNDHYSVELSNADLNMLCNTIPDTLLDSTYRAAKIINIMLLLLKGKYANSNETHYIRDIVNNAINSSLINEDERKHIVINMYYNIPFIGSTDLMEHIITNIIKNAFIHGGGDITLEIWSDYDDNALYFKDDGMGIDQDTISKVFDLFYTKSHDGNGIGLAFCSAAMKFLGGGIECESEPGVFTMFKLTFPTV